MAAKAAKRIYSRSLPSNYIIEMIGQEDFLMFATDYPHWDFDAPDRAIPSSLGSRLREGIFSGNARTFYAF